MLSKKIKNYSCCKLYLYTKRQVMATNSALVETIILKATAMLINNQNETGGIVDFERFNCDMLVCLDEVTSLEDEVIEYAYDLCQKIDEIKALNAYLRDANEQIKSLQSLCRDLRNKETNAIGFCQEQLN